MKQAKNPIDIETTNIESSVLAQNLDAAAGKIMMPIAINVPSAWKPATKLITIKNKKP